jgi:hypothetical protein
MGTLEDWIELLLTQAGVSEALAPYLRLFILLIALILVAGIYSCSPNTS